MEGQAAQRHGPAQGLLETHNALEASGEDVDQLGRADLRVLLDEIRDCDHFPFVKAIYNLYKDWDTALYIMKWMCRIVAGVTCFNEALFIWGLGLSGKDTIVNCLTGLLGHETENGYVGHLKASYFNVSKKGADGAEAPTAFLAALKDARLCVISERAASDGFDGEKLKPLAEQEGSCIPARKLFGHPQAFSMTAAIVALSNHQLDLGTDPDDGLERRIRVDKMPLKFVPKDKIFPDSPSNWQEQDATIKLKAKAGEYAPEMVFVMQALFSSLFIRPGTNIEPTPAQVQNESGEVCASAADSETPKKTLEAWLKSATQPTATKNDASEQKTIHTAMEQLNLKLTAKGSRAALILASGMVKKSDGRGKHFYEWSYPGVGKRLVQLKAV